MSGVVHEFVKTLKARVADQRMIEDSESNDLIVAQKELVELYKLAIRILDLIHSGQKRGWHSIMWRDLSMEIEFPLRESHKQNQKFESIITSIRHSNALETRIVDKLREQLQQETRIKEEHLMERLLDTVRAALPDLIRKEIAHQRQEQVNLPTEHADDD